MERFDVVVLLRKALRWVEVSGARTPPHPSKLGKHKFQEVLRHALSQCYLLGLHNLWMGERGTQERRTT